jgi:hypothetical protein
VLAHYKEQGTDKMELYSIYAIFEHNHNDPKKPRVKHAPFLYTDQKGMDAFIEKYKDTYDVYNTVSLYKGKKHATNDLGVLYRIIIDIDQHFSGITKQEAEEFLRVAQKDFGKVFPTPTKINYSGRGIHIFLEIENSTDIQKYQLVENHLQTIFDNYIGKHFPLWNANIDRRKFYNKLIRVEGTINTKAQAYCENIFKSPTRYELDSLIERHITDLSDIIGEGLRQRAKTEKLHRKEFKTHKREFKGYRKGFTAKTLQESVLSDLEKLQSLRVTNIIKHKDKYIDKGHEGYRNLMLFIYAVYSKYYHEDTNAAYKALQCFNARFKPQPLDEDELSAVFVSSLKSNYTTHKLSTIAEQLELDPNEMQQMKVLFDKDEHKRRQKERVAEQTKRLTKGRQEAKIELIAQVKELKQSGLNASQIALKLNLSRPTVNKYLCQ